MTYFCCFRDCTLHDALAALEDDEDLEPSCIFIEPPDPAMHTDEDSADEDQSGLINNLSGRQLSARCEVVLTSNKNQTSKNSRGTKCSRKVANESLDVSSASRGSGSVRGRGRARGRQRGGRSGTRGSQNNNAVSEELSQTTSSDDSTDDDEPLAKKSRSSTRTWLQEDLCESRPIFPDPDYSKFRGKSPIEMLELFLDESFYEFLVTESQKYAAFLNCPDPKISVDEMIAFIAILVNSGYNTVPSKDHYWDQGDDLRNNLIYNCMRRDRFRTIMRFLHCADNTKMDSSDKMWKLRPLINMLKQKFCENYVPNPNLNYDESMIEYYGRHGCKQFLRGKPIRFGYKNWCLNTPAGYLLDFEIYQGKSINENSEYDKQFGKAASPLVKMIDKLPPNIQSLPMSFYFDNLFTGFPLLNELKNRGYDATGTVRENRLPKNTPLPDKKQMLKKQRGQYSYSKSKEEGIVVVRWKDNSVVTAMSTLHGVQPLTNVTRYSATEKKKVQVPRPALFTNYNKFMGGTDLMDQNINNYRIGIRGKKWWWPIFTYLIDVTICNAWTLSRQAGNNMSQLNFRRHIVKTYLTKFRSAPSSTGRPATSKFSVSGNRVSDDIRYDGIGHLLIPNPQGKRRRCAYPTCKSQTRSECSKCGVGLCLECNFAFHT